MAYPVIAGVAPDNTGAGTSHVFSIPGSISAGNLLVVIFGCQQVVGIGWPAGWTEVHERQGSAISVAVAYRIADGGEGATITVTTTGSCRGTQISYRVTGAHASAAPEVVSSTQSSTSSPDPPAVTPTWGSAETLWIAAVNRAGNTAPTGYPASYSLNQTHQAGSAADNGVAAAGRQNTIATENPGTFAFAAADGSVPLTIAIRPAAAPAVFAGTIPVAFAQTGALKGGMTAAGTIPVAFGQTGALKGGAILAGTTPIIIAAAAALETTGGPDDMAIVKYSTPSAQGSNIASTTLDSLANGSTSTMAAHDNSANLDLYASVLVNLGSFTSTTGASITLESVLQAVSRHARQHRLGRRR